MAHHYLNMSKSIDRRLRVNQSPLRQFYEMPLDSIAILERVNASVDRLMDMTAQEIGGLAHNQKMGSKLYDHIRMLPLLHVEAFVQPLTRGVIRMNLELRASFQWSDRYHGQVESFWIWVEDGENEFIYHSESFLLSKKHLRDVHKLDFVIPVKDPMPPQVACVF